MLLSIITVNLNNKNGLEQTLNSVSVQTFTNFEYIIIDGGSTDGSVDLIKNNCDKVKEWISEKDNGIYDAMNKGIALAQGEYLLFLNSGDYLHQKNSLQNAFTTKPTEDLLFCSVELINKQGAKTITITDKTFQFLISGYVVHQGIIFKKQLFEKIGMYNTNLTLAADYEFIIKAIFKYNCSIKLIDTVLTTYESIHGVSSVSENRDTLKNQRYQALKAVFDERLINILIEKDDKINELLQYKALYTGLLESKSIQLSLKLVHLKRVFKRFLSKKN